jgi:hypothetical protein
LDGGEEVNSAVEFMFCKDADTDTIKQSIIKEFMCSDCICDIVLEVEIYNDKTIIANVLQMIPHDNDEEDDAISLLGKCVINSEKSQSSKLNNSGVFGSLASGGLGGSTAKSGGGGGSTVKSGGLGGSAAKSGGGGFGSLGSVGLGFGGFGGFGSISNIGFEENQKQRVVSQKKYF